MPDPVWFRGRFGDDIVLVDGGEVFELRTEAEARRFLEQLGEKAIEAVDPRALPPGLRADFEASTSRDEQLTVLAQMLSSGRFRVVRLERPFGRLDPVKSVRLSDLIEPKPDEPPAKVKETFTYEVRILDELGEPVAGVPVSLSVSGSSRRLETDGDGRVKVDDATTGSTVVQLPDLVALQDALRPRWEQPRGAQWLDEPDDHTYIDCSAPLPSLQVRAGRLHTIVVQPRVICARILELLFDTSKCFLLPSALEHIRSIRKLYDTRPRAKVLIVGHTDITGDPNVNDPLSLNRAKAVKAYLRDDVQTWLDFFEPHMHPKARWGPHEEQLMLQAVLAESGEDLTDTPLRHFQATRGLAPDGKLGPITREAIITEYMSLDGTTLPEGIEPIAHGCGENFPLEKEDDQDPKAAHAHDRRVELFFFDGDLGVLPPPAGDSSGSGSEEYPEWRSRAQIVHDFIVQPAESDGLIPILQVEDIHFGNERVVFLPEPLRDPAIDDAPREGVTGLSLAREVLQQAHLQPAKKVLFVGHADAVGSNETNLTVSRARADNVKLFVTGDRSAWAEHCIGHYAVDDVQNILLWAAATWGWDTFPGKVDNDLGSLTQGALDSFRREYNSEFDGSIPEQGAVRQADWDAFFDLLQATLEAMLAEGAPALSELQAEVNLLGDGVIACGEAWAHEPILMTGYRETSLRRLDVLFLDAHEVVLAEIQSDPPLREIYGSPLTVVRQLNAGAVPFSQLDYEVWAALRSHWGNLPVGDVQYELIGPHPLQSIAREGVAGDDGEIREIKLLVGNYELRLDGRLIPVAARIMGHHPDGLDGPSHIRVPERAGEQRPLHLFEAPQSGEWVVPGFENDPNAEEPDPEREDGVNDE